MTDASTSTRFLDRLAALRFFRSPRPPHAFVLSEDRVLYVGRAPKAPAGAPPAVASRPLPQGAWRPGPGGVPVGTEGLAKAVAALLVACGAKPGAASLVVPDGFVRSFSVDLSEVPADDREVDEIVRWKASKLFGDPAPAVRVTWRRSVVSREGVRLLALAAPEEAVASWEAAFEAAGIRIGALEPAALAVSHLARPALPRGGVVVWAPDDVATAVFLGAEGVRFVRTRPAADPDDALQEIRLAASYVAGAVGGDVAAAADLGEPCAAGPAGAGVVERLEAFRRENGAPVPEPLSLGRLAPGVSLPPEAASDPRVLEALGILAAS